jgi:hypothetical protein
MAKKSPQLRENPTIVPNKKSSGLLLKVKKFFSKKLVLATILISLVIAGVWIGYNSVPQKEKEQASANETIPTNGYGCGAYNTNPVGYNQDCFIIITNDNLADALEDCTDKTVASNGTYNCTFALEAGYKFPATGDFKAATSTTDNGTTAQATISPNCTYTANATTGNLTCNGIPAPTNNTTGNLDREILLRLGTTGNYTDKGDVTITAGLSEIIFIPQSALTETPNPTTGLKVFGTTDYTLVLKDDRLVEGGKTATCDFRMKEVTAVDGATDTVNVALGYNNVTATTQSIVALNNGGSLTTDAQKYFRVNYNSTTTNTGVSIKFPLAKQIRTDYNIQIRCKRSDNQEFARDQKVNFKFGAYSLVTVGAEQV